MFPDFGNTFENLVEEIKSYLRIDTSTMYISDETVNSIIESYRGEPATRETLSRIGNDIDTANQNARVGRPRQRAVAIPNPINFWREMGVAPGNVNFVSSVNSDKLRLIEQLVRSDVFALTSDDQRPFHLSGIVETIVRIHTRGPIRPALGLDPILDMIPEEEQNEAIHVAFAAFVDKLTDIAAAGGVIQDAALSPMESVKPARRSRPGVDSNEIDIEIDIDRNEINIDIDIDIDID